MQRNATSKTKSTAILRIKKTLVALSLVSSAMFTTELMAANPPVPQLSKEQVISQLKLSHHFEGGYFRQTFKANHRDKVTTPRGDRTTMTAIFYMLTDDNNIDHFHTKHSDGIEFYHMGAPITYHMIYPDGRYEKVVVGPDIQNGQQLQLAVPGGTYKAAELLAGTYGLVSEAVAPGWEKEDMIEINREALLEKFPQHKTIIDRLANKNKH